MAQFPLALAVEPRLLPHAVANGFTMDYKASGLFHFHTSPLMFSILVSRLRIP